MPLRTYDLTALDELIRRHEKILTRQQLLATGMDDATIARRTRAGGSWQRVLPGVYATHAGTPTRRERLLAAAAYGGPGSLISGAAALDLWGARTATERTVRLLVPHERRRKSVGFVVVERSRRLPSGQRVRGIPAAPIARAVIDECRHQGRLDDVRALIATVVQGSRCSPAQLREELERAARAGSALPRRVMDEIGHGIRSVAEAQARAALRRRRIRPARWNVDVYTPEGTFLCRADALWEDVGAVLELDSMAWHLNPAGYKRTQRRQRWMTTHGLLVLPYAPGDVLADEDTFGDDVEALLIEAERRPAPRLLVVEAGQVRPHMIGGALLA